MACSEAPTRVSVEVLVEEQAVVPFAASAVETMVWHRRASTVVIGFEKSNETLAKSIR